MTYGVGIEPDQPHDFYHLLFEMTPDPVIVHDYEHVIAVNRAAWTYFSAPEGITGPVSPWSMLEPGQREWLVERFGVLGVDGRPTPPVPIRVRTFDGEPREVELSSAKVRWEGRDAIISVLRDLTERTRAEATLRQVEERYAAVVRHAPLGMHFYRLEACGQLVFTGANPAADELLGVDHGVLVGLSIEQAWRGLAETSVPDELRRVIREQTVWDTPALSYEATDGVFEVVAFATGADSCAEMFWDVSDRIRTQTELDRYRHHLERLVAERTEQLEVAHRNVEAIAAVAARAVELRDPYTAGHQRRAAELSYAIAVRLGLGEEQAGRVQVAAKLHDIGKLSVPAEILAKPGRLSAAETEIVRSHAVAAHDILSEARIGWPLAEMVGQHHERLDGTGYPEGLSGDDIMIEARILAVADVVEAMSSHRPYRPALGMSVAAEEITRLSGTVYDADVVSACLEVLGSGFEFAEAG